tara:strand:- start:1432 stop:3489 length:2058 start_codon:yes stop_codon:yes gene_type:complete
MSLLSYFRRQAPLFRTDNLFDYLGEYGPRVAEEARQAMEGIQHYPERLQSALQLITSPIAPVVGDLFRQAGEVAAPGVNLHQQAIIDAQNQLAERLGRPTQNYTPMSGEQVGQQLAMAGSLMRGKFPTPRPNWVSPSQIAIRGFQPKATGQQYAKALEKEKGAIAEAKETGLLTALQETPGTITQEQALSMVSPLELTETIKGGGLPPVNVDSPYAIPEVLSIGRRSYPTELETVLANDYDAYSALESQFPDLMENEDWGEIVVRDVFGVTDYTDTKFGREENLNLPGGTNAKEILVQLPTVKDTAPPYSQWLESKGYSDRHAHMGEYQREYPPKDVTEFTKGHWKEPNVLVHIRTNERDVGGRKALHLEEIQSDWHQQGRDKGYASGESPDTSGWVARVEEGLGTSEPGWSIKDAYGNKVAEGGRSIWYGKTPEDAITQAAQFKAEGVGKVPDAPFKNNWHELGWKRGFMEALRDPSIERLTWTSGDVQVDRNNVAEQVESVYWKPDTQEFNAILKGGADSIDRVVPREKLADVIGKEVAERLLEAPRNDFGSHVLEGVDLEIGGEFHKNLYDKKITQFAKKFLKDFGVEPKKIAIWGTDPSISVQIDDSVPDRPDFDVYRNNYFVKSLPSMEAVEQEFGKENQFWYIDITPEMREHFMKQGIKMTMAPNQMGLLPEQEMRLLA